MCFWTSFYTSKHLPKKQAIHTAPRIVMSCPYLIANRVVVVLCEPLGHFLFLFLPLSNSSVGQYGTDLKQLTRKSSLHKCHCLFNVV